jgi:hypothetical protein
MYEPANTCPLINEIQGEVSDLLSSLGDDIKSDYEEYYSKGFFEDLSDWLHHIAVEIHENLEKVRDANSGLREWGHTLVEELRERDETLGLLREDIDRLTEELDNVSKQ